MYRTGISAASYVSVPTVSPESAESFYKMAEAYVAQAKEDGSLPPGRAEQYDIQLATLKYECIPDLELVNFTGFITFLACKLSSGRPVSANNNLHIAAMPEPAKLYVNFLIILPHEQGHSFSLGLADGLPASLVR